LVRVDSVEIQEKRLFGKTRERIEKEALVYAIDAAILPDKRLVKTGKRII
jgi:hypothetical protein